MIKSVIVFVPFVICLYSPGRLTATRRSANRVGTGMLTFIPKRRILFHAYLGAVMFNSTQGYYIAATTVYNIARA